jgi:hypothetical protein
MRESHERRYGIGWFWFHTWDAESDKAGTLCLDYDLNRTTTILSPMQTGGAAPDTAGNFVSPDDARGNLSALSRAPHRGPRPYRGPIAPLFVAAVCTRVMAR